MAPVPSNFHPNLPPKHAIKSGLRANSETNVLNNAITRKTKNPKLPALATLPILLMNLQGLAPSRRTRMKI
jgi:hypothetical protein